MEELVKLAPGSISGEKFKNSLLPVDFYLNAGKNSWKRDVVTAWVISKLTDRGLNPIEAIAGQ